MNTTFTIPGRVLRAMNLIIKRSRDNARMELAALRIERGDEHHLEGVAVDGTRLLKFVAPVVPFGVPEDFKPLSLDMPAPAQLGVGKTDWQVEVCDDGSGVILRQGARSHGVHVIVDHEFPDWRRVCPTSWVRDVSSVTGVLAFDHVLASDTLRALGAEVVEVQFGVGPELELPHSPLRFVMPAHENNEDLLFILMPCRGSNS